MNLKVTLKSEFKRNFEIGISKELSNQIKKTTFKSIFIMNFKIEI